MQSALPGKLSGKRAFALYSISLTYLVSGIYRYVNLPLPDFSVFWAAGQSVSTSQTPYISLSPSLPYLNGPFFSALLSLFTDLNFKTAFGIWLVLNGFFIWICALLVARRFGLSFTPVVSSIFALAVISYPVRMNMAQGQVISFALFLVVIAFLGRDARMRSWTSWTSALALVFAFELKPYLIILLILLLIYERRIVFLIQAASLLIVMNIYYWVFLVDSTWISWIQAMQKRSEGLVSDKTQVSLLSLIYNNLPLPLGFAIFAYATSVLLILLVSLRNWKSEDDLVKFGLVLALGPILSPYSHEFDFIFSIFGMLIVLAKTRMQVSNKLLSILLFGIYLNLNDTAIPSTLLVLVFYISILLLTHFLTTAQEIILVASIVVFIQNLPIFLNQYFFQIDNAQFRKSISLLLGYLCWYLIIKSRREINLATTQRSEKEYP